MSLTDTLRFILRHPLNAGERAQALRRYVGWQIGSRIVPGPVIVEFVNGSRLIMSPGRTGATANLYVGLGELEEMAFVAHALRSGDLFVDVGANIGAYTILAACTSGAMCVAFEPSPQAYARLVENIRLNDIVGQAVAHQAAVGSAKGEIDFTSGFDTVNHVVAVGEESSSVVVSMTTLDAAFEGEKPTLIKIDVEGFESDVIRGAARILADHDLLAVVIEMNGSGARYGYDDASIHDALVDHGFERVCYRPAERNLGPTDRAGSDGNHIYVRELDEMRRRVTTAPPIDVAGRRRL